MFQNLKNMHIIEFRIAHSRASFRFKQLFFESMFRLEKIS